MDKKTDADKQSRKGVNVLDTRQGRDEAVAANDKRNNMLNTKVLLLVATLLVYAVTRTPRVS